MNGAESLVRTLVNGEVNVCFANPGTSEMHFVSALDRVEGVRCILGLFEGVVTGAADGYYRMAGKPAATLLHLGPGLGNGLANLHNAKKARSGMVNIVGEHASYHIRHDAPLTADIEGVARPMSDWVLTSRSSRAVAGDGAQAITAARTAPGQIATLILPADTAWGEADGPAAVAAPQPRTTVDGAAIDAAAQVLRSGRPAAILLGGAALRGKALDWAGRIAAKTGCTLLCEYNNARMERGAGRAVVRQLPFAVDAALAVLKDVRELVLVGAKTPVSFFAYPGKPSVLVPEGCHVTRVAGAEADLEQALEALADVLGARGAAPRVNAASHDTALPSGAVTLEGLGALFNSLLPEDAVVIDEAVTSGRAFTGAMMGARPHDWLNIMGGSIGWGPAAATGAAIAAPGRKVVAFEGDGSAQYTLQALWTMARESLDVTMVVFANRAYKILLGELNNVGAAAPGANARSMLTLDRPDLDWVALAKGYGVEAGRAATLDELATQFRRGLAVNGPYLVELLM
ncbi:MAG: acetolactate synthase large subunit [Betaproteobacteria bacterium]|jgi:acetolactate synthase-1/2/3 large subunit|nr:acetolactate synthase large subunit [Betaproteobacteria bacterium]